MSLHEAEQLDFAGAIDRAAKPRKPSKLRAICKCLHEDRDHAGKKGPCSFGAHVGNPCPCKRFKPRGRPVVTQPAHLVAPPGAILLERDDLKIRKRMGWAVVGRDGVAVYLEQFKTKSPNVSWTGGANAGFLAQRRFAALANYKKACRDRTTSAIAQCAFAFADRGRPLCVTITRVSSGTLDDDNLGGALKHIRDGVADALDIDDKEFSLTGSAGKIPLFYSQEKPGARRVCGVRIAIAWRTT